jgi:hypothetical protein
LVDVRSVTERWRVRRDTRGVDRGLMPDPVWLIPGRRGHVEAFDLETLCVYVTGRTLPRLLRELPAGWRVHQRGDDEANLLCPLADLDRAAAIVKAYRRRKLSPEDIAAKRERLRIARQSRVAGRSSVKNGPEAAEQGGDSTRADLDAEAAREEARS